MKRTRAEMRADLMHGAELLDWNEQTSEPTLTQIEEVVLKLRRRLSEQMALAVMELQEATRSAPSPRCPTCQVEMHYKKMKENTVESRVGQLALNRGDYYCETCRIGLFPLAAPKNINGVNCHLKPCGVNYRMTYLGGDQDEQPRTRAASGQGTRAMLLAGVGTRLSLCA